MADIAAVETIPHLGKLGNIVPEGYEYYEKVVTPEQDLSLPRVYLKWYNICRPDVVISEGQLAESRAFVAAEAERLRLNDELGFVLLHHCGLVLLLMINTWRNTNEIWESAYAKDLPQASGYQPITSENNHRGTFCVWELGPVWHERQAWVRFLASARDEAAKLAYINDRFAGRV
ncbi:MAG TPA: hypothetical protein VKT82_28030 [Ktedonobacterales bacterium]|nr:hypothetical protein [Ktedonobacterales bacterium]